MPSDLRDLAQTWIDKLLRLMVGGPTLEGLGGSGSLPQKVRAIDIIEGFEAHCGHLSLHAGAQNRQELGVSRVGSFDMGASK